MSRLRNYKKHCFVPILNDTIEIGGTANSQKEAMNRFWGNEAIKSLMKNHGYKFIRLEICKDRILENSLLNYLRLKYIRFRRKNRN